jgi:hypothetical protein
MYFSFFKGVEKGKEKERKEMKIKVRLVLEAQV